MSLSHSVVYQAVMIRNSYWFLCRTQIDTRCTLLLVPRPQCMFVNALLSLNSTIYFTPVYITLSTENIFLRFFPRDAMLPRCMLWPCVHNMSEFCQNGDKRRSLKQCCMIAWRLLVFWGQRSW